MRFVQIRGCNLQVKRKLEVPYYAKRILAEATHVHQPLMRRRYAHLLHGGKSSLPKGMHLTVTPHTMGIRCPAVVRNWMKRRYEQAIYGCMRSRGFDCQGNCIAPAGRDEMSNRSSTRQRRGPSIYQLRGAVNVSLQSETCRFTWQDIQQQAASIVEEIIKRCSVYKEFSNSDNATTAIKA